ncbi:MAG: hypothetical protein Q7V19_05010, partial [Bacteroidales bacterium]|nr:hypothetical protein [Bacteroidales bacterium]
ATMVIVSSVITLMGILINRLNVSLIAYNIDAPVRYVPTWQELTVSLAIILIQIWVFRWIILRMPVLRNGPDWAKGH